MEENERTERSDKTWRSEESFPDKIRYDTIRYNGKVAGYKCKMNNPNFMWSIPFLFIVRLLTINKQFKENLTRVFFSKNSINQKPILIESFYLAWSENHHIEYHDYSVTGSEGSI